MNCTHTPGAHLKVGDECSICGNKIVVELSALATRGGEEVGSAPTLETYSHLPAAHIAVRSVPILAGLPAPETTPPVVVSGAPIARNTDPQPAHDAAARATHGYRFDEWLVLAAHVASRDLSGDELGTVCGRPYQSVGPRRPALKERGHVEPVLDAKGKQVVRGGKGIWRATDEGRAAWRDCPESIRPTVLAQLTNTAVMALRGAA